jgi:hypothetical protein
VTDSIKAYRKKVIAAHPAAFALHTEVAGTLQEAIEVPRAHPTDVHIVLDMLMLQAGKAHAAVSILAQHGLMEDTATIARRLMELGVQAVYIGAESEDKERQKRAGTYLAFMWRQLPPRIKHRLPLPIRTVWSKIARRHGRFVSAKAKTWGPRWRDMFREIGSETLYLKDYSFLSAIAHGRPDNQFFTFSRSTIKVHSHEFAPVLLGYSSRYYLVVAEQWNRLFKTLPAEVFDTLVRDTMA